jgi:hypothetical protein
MPVRKTSPGRKPVSHIFTPARNREDYERILFALKACDKSIGRAFTNILHIERANNGSLLVATDGKRLHCAEIKKRIAPGDYKPVVSKNTVKLGMPIPYVNFPNWKNVVPVNVFRRGCINIENTVINGNSRILRSFTKMTGEKVSPDYLADLAKKTWAVYSQNDKRKAMVLKEYGAENKMYAVIMPLSA